MTLQIFGQKYALNSWPNTYDGQQKVSSNGASSCYSYGNVAVKFINLLKPTGYVTHQQV
jgi:hypothetical protein